MTAPRSRTGPADAERDRRDDLRVLLWTTGALLLTFSIGSTLQTIFLFRPERLTVLQLADQAPMLPARLFTNLATVAVVLAVCAVAGLSRRPPGARAVWVAVLALGAGFARHGLQLLLGIYDHPRLATSAVEVGSVAAVVALSVGLGIAQVQARVRLRAHERASAEQRLRASTALADLAAEEIRVRREVAEGLHGTLQGRLVMSQARLEQIVRTGRDEGWSAAGIHRLEDLGRELETIREHDVREFSQLLYPAGVDVGLSHAVRMLVRRVPADIAVSAEVSSQADAVVDGAGPEELGRRIALVRATEEAVTNALRHGAATEIRIAADAAHADGGHVLRLTVEDDGSGLPEAPQWSGLERVAERIGRYGGTVGLGSSPLGGGRLEIVLPTA